MIRLAIIGTGGMANHQANGFAAIRGCKLVACADIDLGRAQAFAEKHGIGQAYGDAEEMLTREKLDGVSIVTPDSSHAAVALLALRHGVHVMCEKPLATNAADAAQMAEEAARRGALTAVNFSYRNSPATQKAAEIVAGGALGALRHVEGRYLQSWLCGMEMEEGKANPGMLWRLSTRHGSHGVLGDLGVHLYDLAQFIVGDFAEIRCDLQTFPKAKDCLGEYVFDANDSAVATVRFANGALGTLHTTRWAAGHANTVGIRVYGELGGIDLDLDRSDGDQLRMFTIPADYTGWNSDITWKSVKCPKTPNMYERFVKSLKTGVQGQTSFQGGARIQRYLDAAMASSQTQAYVRV